MPTQQKTRIIECASSVFYEHGYRATGVSLLAKAAGITKATLYHHFESKDELIEETLNFLSDYHHNNYKKAWNKKGLSAKDRLLVLFDEMDAAFKQPDCFGCPFINVAAEYTDRNSAPRKISAAHYAFLTAHLEQFASDAGLREPRIVAEQITTAIAGAYTAWFVAGIKEAAQRGKETAQLIISAHSKD